MLQTEIRKEIPQVPSTVGAPQDLAVECAELLGYTLLSKAKSGEKPICGPLRQALHELEIETLIRSDVDKYKIDHFIEQNKLKVNEWLTELCDEKQNGRRSYRWTSNSFYALDWAEVEITKYEEAIPVHVLNKAVQIKKAVPEVQFFVDHLRETPDPFLVAKLGEEVFYVEVWNEPKFESEL